ESHIGHCGESHIPRDESFQPFCAKLLSAGWCHRRQQQIVNPGGASGWQQAVEIAVVLAWRRLATVSPALLAGALHSKRNARHRDLEKLQELGRRTPRIAPAPQEANLEVVQWVHIRVPQADRFREHGLA